MPLLLLWGGCLRPDLSVFPLLVLLRLLVLLSPRTRLLSNGYRAIRGGSGVCSICRRRRRRTRGSSESESSSVSSTIACAVCCDTLLLLRPEENSRGRREGSGGRYRKRKTRDSTREATQALGAMVMLISDTLLWTVKSDCIPSDGVAVSRPAKSRFVCFGCDGRKG